MHYIPLAQLHLAASRAEWRRSTPRQDVYTQAGGVHPGRRSTPRQEVYTQAGGVHPGRRSPEGEGGEMAGLGRLFVRQ